MLGNDPKDNTPEKLKRRRREMARRHQRLRAKAKKRKHGPAQHVRDPKWLTLEHCHHCEWRVPAKSKSPGAAVRQHHEGIHGSMWRKKTMTLWSWIPDDSPVPERLYEVSGRGRERIHTMGAYTPWMSTQLTPTPCCPPCRPPCPLPCCPPPQLYGFYCRTGDREMRLRAQRDKGIRHWRRAFTKALREGPSAPPPPMKKPARRFACATSSAPWPPSSCS